MCSDFHAKKHDVMYYPDGRLDAENAASYVGLSPKTLAAMRCKGTGPRFIKRGRIFYFRDDLDAWLNAGGRFSSTAQVAAARTGVHV